MKSDLLSQLKYVRDLCLSGGEFCNFCPYLKPSDVPGEGSCKIADIVGKPPYLWEVEE